MQKTRAVVVLSGGQDSVTTLLMALADPAVEVVGAIHFTYRQRHAVERDLAQRWCDVKEIPLEVVTVDALAQLGNSALVDGTDVNQAHPTLKDLPASFVPGRNLVFLTLAAAYAMRMGATQVWTGVCQADSSGYPDCRLMPLFMLQGALREGMAFPELEIVTPLMDKTKADTWAIAAELDHLEEVVEHTHTCYLGDRTQRHPWGYGCGTCPSCQLRERGWREFGEKVAYAGA